MTLFFDPDKLISAMKHFVILSSAGFQANYSANDPEKMDNIIRFMFENYHREISLDEISVIANMTKQAFCRYFKNRTQKSFIQFLNEIRISYSCQMINQGDEFLGSTIIIKNNK